MVGFSPTSFVIPDREDGEDENLGGDQKVLDMTFFPRQQKEPTEPAVDIEKFSKTKITNLPKDITDEQALEFMNSNVDKSVTLEDMEIVRNDLNSQIILGPGPSRSVVAKAAETLDFHKTQK